MISENVLKECVETNEASVKDYLSQFFHIKELDFFQLRQTMFAEVLGMPVSDIKRVSDAKCRSISLLYSKDSSQTDALVPIKYIEVPGRSSDLKCYRFSLKASVDELIRKHYIKNLEGLDREEREGALFVEEKRIDLLSFFYPSSLLSLIHRQCPLIEKAMAEYEKFESLEELQHLVSGLSPYTGCNRPKRDFRI